MWEAAGRRACELGVDAVSAEAGAILRLHTQLLGARAVVEVGTGAGVSGLWLLDGMRPEGTLTTIDTEPEQHRAARQAFREAGIPPARTRLITGRALDVLPRLADEAYDLVFVDAARMEFPYYVAEAVRLLRVGGAVVVRCAGLAEGQFGVLEDANFTTVVIPVGGGLVCSVKG